VTRVLLSGGLVFDVISGQAASADVVLDGQRISDVGRGLDADDEICVDGCLLVPGFIDCHTHIALTERLGGQGARMPPAVYALSAVPVLRTLLERGVTTVRDAWGAGESLRTALDRGWVDGPDLLTSVRQLSTTGGIGDHWSPGLGDRNDEDPELPSSVFDGPDQARAAVRRMVRAGADWIKVAATGSLSQGARARNVQLTEAELTAVVDEAARHGARQVMVHAHSGAAVQLAVRCGARSVEHGIWLDETAVGVMAEAGMWLVPTLSVTQSRPDALPAEIVQAHRDSFRFAVAAGVPIAMGTDNPVTPHADVLREIEHMAALGLDSVGALRAATIGAATLLKLESDRGEIAAGKRADIIVLEGTTLDVSQLARRVSMVWHNGTQVRPRI
jgi:imidazolonepropionase-like amidohydrolase